MALGFVVLGMEYPGADGGGLVGEEVALAGVSPGASKRPGGLFGLFADGVAALFESGFYGSNVCRDAMSFARLGFFHGYSIKMRH